MIGYIRSTWFKKQYKKLDKNIKEAFSIRFGLFLEQPFHPMLNNHGLQGERLGERSINITGVYRLIFEYINADTVRLLDIDTHHNLYGK